MFKKISLLIAVILILIPTIRAQAQVGDLLGQIVGGITGTGGAQNVRIIGDASEASLTTAIKTTLSAITGERTADAISQLVLKETVLDPAAWGMAKQLQQQLTGEFLKWLGGQQPGQNGEVPFVQDYDEYFSDIVDQEVGQYLFNEKAGDATGQCSPEESHQVITAALNSYNVKKQRSQNGGALQCSDQNNNSYKNGLDELVGDFLNCKDRLCEFFTTETELQRRTTNAIENERMILTISNGFKPQRVCNEVTTAGGVSRSDCKIVNPLTLGSDMSSFNLVEMPGLQMLNMDEFNEVASNLMNNLANQALQGLTGVLGLTGNPSFSVNIFGTEGNLSYVDALTRDSVTNYQSNTANPIKDSIKIETDFATMQRQILTEISAIDSKLQSNEEQFGNCFDMELTEELTKAKTTVSTNSDIASTSLAILNVLDQQYDSTNDFNVRNSVLMSYTDFKDKGYFHTAYQNEEFKITYLDLEFAKMTDRFRYDMAVERQKCGGDFDYEGILDS